MKPSISYVLNLVFLAAPIVVLAPRPGLTQPGMLDVRTYRSPLEVHEWRPDEKACLTQFADVAKRDALGTGNSSVIPYECPYVLLVNRRTGEETTLGGWPKLSPNKTRFVVSASFVAGECGPDYNLAVFSLASDPPRLEWKFTGESVDEDYYIDGWDGENRVRLRANINGKETATDLRLTAQGWQLRRPHGKLSLGVPARPAQANDPRSAPSPPPSHRPAADRSLARLLRGARNLREVAIPLPREYESGVGHSPPGRARSKPGYVGLPRIATGFCLTNIPKPQQMHSHS